MDEGRMARPLASGYRATAPSGAGHGAGSVPGKPTPSGFWQPATVRGRTAYGAWGEESTGRLILNDDKGVYSYEDGTWAATLSDVKVEYIGEAAPGMTAKVILSDWNEG
jgi:hypothetical protein